MAINPAEVFQGVTVITVPHMDDGVLACGGTIAKLLNKEEIHVIYATDGMGSPAPVLPWRDSISADLGLVRMKEAKDAMGYLGVPQENIHFLNLPDGRLKSYKNDLWDLLVPLLGQIKPANILTPFRYDRHTDHLALNHVITAACQQSAFRTKLIEYFVYYRWRLLPEGDIRRYIRPQCLYQVDIGDVSTIKKTALECFKSQTTKFYPWQTRPNLTEQLLNEVSQTPELFLEYDEAFSGSAVFTRAVIWIRLAHWLEPFLKKKKDQAVALWRTGWQRNG